MGCSRINSSDVRHVRRDRSNRRTTQSLKSIVDTPSHNEHNPKMISAVKLQTPYAKEYIRYGEKWGVSPYLLAAQGHAESMNWDADVIACHHASSKGAQGIAQFMDATARGRNVDPCDVDSAINGQAHLMADLLARYSNDQAKALAGYNAGTGAVDKYHGVPPYKETSRYVSFILNEKVRLEHDGH